MKSRLKSAMASLKRELSFYRDIARDPRTPWHSRALLSLAIGYLLSPIDIIPDFIPVIGHLDDAVIVPLLVILAMRSVPRVVVEDCRRNQLVSPPVTRDVAPN
ncbi:MAG TPA: YkvA family protein [Armatimonadota bacterium]|jgi:uncharacterized membrane protein YkvA (DUF1232 family)